MLYSSAIPNLVGHSIDGGRLRFTDMIGSGSNGIIFLAIDTTSHVANRTKYAVKCLVKGQKGTRQYELQKQEIFYHKLVSYHPNVVTLHHVVEDNFYFFLVLDYCRGGDLFSLLSQPTALRGNSILVKRIYLQILDAVEACHAVGIFHRDIKPENILCNEDGSRVYLSDFGLATRKTHSMSFGAGSVYYMSPECIGEDVGREGYSTRANDVWALGVILTSMISGHNPWRKASYTDECYKSFQRNPDFLRDMLPISAGANAILQRTFKHDPSRRVCIPRLRAMIIQLDTFFLLADEIAVSNRYVKKVAKEFLNNGVEEVMYDGSSGDQDCHLKSCREEVAFSPTAIDRINSLETVSLGESSCSDRDEIRCIPRSCPTNTITFSWEEPSDESYGHPIPKLDPHPSFSSLGVPKHVAVSLITSAGNSLSLSKRRAFTSSPGVQFFRRVAARFFV
ncbi:kinase-like domain-containing protein [Sparassis latifolia]